MSHILNTKINLSGVIYRRGQDITDLATPGEIASLISAGVLDVVALEMDLEEDPIGDQADSDTVAIAEPSDEPDGDSDDAEIEQSDEGTEPESDSKSDEDESSDDQGDSEESPSVDVLKLAQDTIEKLKAGNVHTIADAWQYLEDHGSFKPITFIGEVTNSQIITALRQQLSVEA